MNSSEVVVDMSQQEMNCLRKMVRLPLVFYLVQLIVGGIWISFLSVEDILFLPKLLFGISVLVFFLVFNFIAYWMRRLILLDIKSGQKKWLPVYWKGSVRTPRDIVASTI